MQAFLRVFSTGFSMEKTKSREWFFPKGEYLDL
jgi:hypothetical protein